MDFKIIFVIGVLSLTLLISTTTPVFATHNTSPEANAYLFKITGNGGSLNWGKDINKFVEDNNGVVHNSNWNDYHWQQARKDAGLYGGGTADIFPCDGVNPPGAALPPGQFRDWTKNVNEYTVGLHESILTDRGAKLMLIGFSFGGAGTAFVASDPRNNNVDFDMVYVTDPVGPNGNRVNVIRDVGWEHLEDPCQWEGFNSPCPVLNPASLVITTKEFFNCADLDNITDGEQSLRVIPPNVRMFVNFWQPHGVAPADNFVEIFDLVFHAGTLCPFATPDHLEPGDLEWCRPVSSFVSNAGVSVQEVTVPPGCGPVPPREDEDIINYFARIINNIAGVFLGPCHASMGDLNQEIIKNLMRPWNSSPALEDPGSFDIDELDIMMLTATDSPTSREETNKMFNAFRFFDPITGEEAERGIVKEVLHGQPGKVPSDALDGGATPTDYLIRMQVYDSGFPCNDCLGVNKGISGEAKGSWHDRMVPVTVTNIPPITSVELLTPFTAPVTANTHDDSDTCHPHPDAHIIENPNIVISVSTIDSIPDMNAGMEYRVEWGDGFQSTGETNANESIEFVHTIRKAGDATITTFATDKDGSVGQASIIVNLPDSDCDGIQDLIDTIPEEFSDDYDDPVPTCENGVLNTETNTCEENPNICVDGKIFNPNTGQCEAPIICLAGMPGLFNPDKDLCEIKPPCEEGDYNVMTSRCEAPAFCPPDFTLNPDMDICVDDDVPVITFPPVCLGPIPSPFPLPGNPPNLPSDVLTYNPQTNVCDVNRGSCPASFGFSTNTNLCEAAPICQGDTMYKPETKSCEAPPMCEGGTMFNPGTGQCESPSMCQGDTMFNPETGKCEEGQFGTIIDRGDQDVSIIDEDFEGTEPFCESGSRTYNIITNRCEPAPLPSCPFLGLMPFCALCLFVPYALPLVPLYPPPHPTLLTHLYTTRPPNLKAEQSLSISH